MKQSIYSAQVKLLVQSIPEVAKETCFALHGGTAINLFVRELPRLSVDIDLTYVPIEPRDVTLQRINEALGRIKLSLETVLPNVRVVHRKNICKLHVSTRDAQIKIEVNQIGRGTLDAPVTMPLCKSAQDEYDAFCEIQLVPIGQLYGGKICAALDRQHPRDLFDVKCLFENEGITKQIKTGMLLCLLSSDRPVHELLHPNLQDQRTTMTNHFDGMSAEEFTYTDFEHTRDNLISGVNKRLTDEDRVFLLKFKNLTPDWSLYDFEDFPAVRWKMLNLQKLKDSNPKKHLQQYEALEKLFA
jgi:predicted nucleotidyltransferase component of viral defense system